MRSDRPQGVVQRSDGAPMWSHAFTPPDTTRVPTATSASREKAPTSVGRPDHGVPLSAAARDAGSPGREQAEQPPDPRARRHHVQVGRDHGQASWRVGPGMAGEDRCQGDEKGRGQQDVPAGPAASSGTAQRSPRGRDEPGGGVQPPSGAPGRSRRQGGEAGAGVVREPRPRLEPEPQGKGHQEQRGSGRRDPPCTRGNAFRDIFRKAGLRRGAQHDHLEGDRPQ